MWLYWVLALPRYPAQDRVWTLSLNPPWNPSRWATLNAGVQMRKQTQRGQESHRGFQCRTGGQALNPKAMLSEMDKGCRHRKKTWHWSSTPPNAATLAFPTGHGTCHAQSHGHWTLYLCLHFSAWTSGLPFHVYQRVCGSPELILCWVSLCCQEPDLPATLVCTLVPSRLAPGCEQVGLPQWAPSLLDHFPRWVATSGFHVSWKFFW